MFIFIYNITNLAIQFKIIKKSYLLYFVMIIIILDQFKYSLNLNIV